MALEWGFSRAIFGTTKGGEVTVGRLPFPPGFRM